MARDAKKKGKKKKPTTATKTTKSKNISGVVLDAKNGKWKQEVDDLPADVALPVYEPDVEDIDWTFWKCIDAEKKSFYCDTGGHDGKSGEKTLKKVEWAFLFGPKSKPGRYAGEKYEAQCTSNPADPPAPESMFSDHPYWLPLFHDVWGRPIPGRQVPDRPISDGPIPDQPIHRPIPNRPIPGRQIVKRPG